jgi:predicted nucleic acid-binding protein
VIHGERRDVLLDSGAVSALARDRKLLEGYLRLVEEDFDGAIRIPQPVLGEVYTGEARYDVVLDRLINELCAKENIIEPLTDALAKRAGALRHKSLKIDDRIEVVDAFVVAIAETLSHRCPIVILTGDVNHINVLVGQTRRKNIAVELVG